MLLFLFHILEVAKFAVDYMVNVIRERCEIYCQLYSHFIRGRCEVNRWLYGKLHVMVVWKITGQLPLLYEGVVKEIIKMQVQVYLFFRKQTNAIFYRCLSYWSSWRVVYKECFCIVIPLECIHNAPIQFCPFDAQV